MAVSGLGDIEYLKRFDPPEYRLGVGDWRVRHRLENDSTPIVRVLHRREAYRKSALARQAIPDPGDFDEIADSDGPEIRIA